MRIREAQKSDWPRIYRLMEDNMYDMQKALGLPWNKEAIHQHYMSKEILVDEDEGSLRGFIAFDFNGKQQFIHSLQVAKKYQNRLCGFRLFRASLKQANLSGVEVIRCCVFANNNAKSVYVSLGFVETLVEKDIVHLEAKSEVIKSKVMSKALK